MKAANDWASRSVRLQHATTWVLALALAGGAPAEGREHDSDALRQDQAGVDQRVVAPLAGLLELPDVIGPPCGLPNGRRETLRAWPSRSAGHVGTLWYKVTPRPGLQACDDTTLVLEQPNGVTSAMPTMEIGYEEQALIVTEVRGRWFKVQGPDSLVWIERTPSDYTSYEDLLANDALTYLRSGWTGRLWPSPGTGRPTVIGPPWRTAADDTEVVVLGKRRIAGALWLRVRLRRESCGSEIAPPDSVEPTGWVPAYRDRGETVAWFHSRGC